MTTEAQKALKNSNPTPGRYSDGQNLYLKVAKGGSKSWVFMSRLCGELGLGSATGAGKAGKLSRQQARQKANAIHVMLAEGKDPRTQLKRHSKAVNTFGTVALACIDSLKAGWKNPAKDSTSWQNSLEQHASLLTKRNVATITTEDVLGVLSRSGRQSRRSPRQCVPASSACWTMPGPRITAAATTRQDGAAIWR